MTEIFTYGLRNRPAMYGTVPTGFTNEQPHEDYTYGTIDYDHKLTDEEVYKYELTPVSANTYKFAIDQRVLVNEIDLAVIASHDWNGTYTVMYVNFLHRESGIRERDLEPIGDDDGNS